MSKKLNYISLFSCAGVGCYGFFQENYQCLATVELKPKRIKIQEFNNICKFSSGYISGDIILDETKNKIFIETETNNNTEVDVLIATPPCQGISVANLKKKNEIKRNSLVVESIKLIKKINPKIFIFENVRGFLKATCTDIDFKEKPIKDAIISNLSEKYNIEYKIINFKDYGCPSSRTRTIVIGSRRDLLNIQTTKLFPSEQVEKNLRETIGYLESLKYGEISKDDIYHNFRVYPKYMIPWIKYLKEGESAFSNKNFDRIPYSIKNGIKVQNANKNADKYKRCFWDKIGPCIHTRNDQLASQNTIHPKDNRVFSIRELMLLMSIPSEFKWSNIPLEILNNMELDEKKRYLKENELNIRQCIGEAVPTIIFRQMAKKIKEML